MPRFLDHAVVARLGPDPSVLEPQLHHGAEGGSPQRPRGELRVPDRLRCDGHGGRRRRRGGAGAGASLLHQAESRRAARPGDHARLRGGRGHEPHRDGPLQSEFPTSAFFNCISTGMHGPTCLFWANLLTTLSLQGSSSSRLPGPGRAARALRRQRHA
jgi:hypothetical protein